LAFHADRMTLPQVDATESPIAARRAALFRESLAGRLERYALGTAWALMPKRIGGLPGLAKMWTRELLAPDHALPDPDAAGADGLAGIVHDLSPQNLIAAHRKGLFPFAHIAPLKWWSPPNRSLLFFPEFHISKRLRRQMRQGQYTVTFDKDFEGVITACSQSRSGRWHLTWITPRIMRAYAEAFDAGHVHSFEVWNDKGELAGGGYGVSMGGAFVTESQFSRETNTSKMGFTVFNWHLAKWGYAFNDGKLMTPTCKDQGFRELPRAEFLDRMADAIKLPGKSGRWQVEADMAQVSEWKPEAD